GTNIFSSELPPYKFEQMNCFFQLTLRHVMDSAKQATKSGNLNELSMVLLNNVLSLPLGIILVLGFNEASSEDAYVLASHHCKRSFGACYQLYFHVVSSSDKRNNL
uniref:Uncharacterized protein n=1 Tax=Aegilops tauschii subsp. strangulata TaxID=200361 RepID=A0A453S439_AEGTS